MLELLLIEVTDSDMSIDRGHCVRTVIDRGHCVRTVIDRGHCDRTVIDRGH